MVPQTTEWMSLPAGVSAPAPLFTLSDAHGVSDLMGEAVLFASGLSSGHGLVSLGDLIDRGPDPVGCVRIALRAARDERFSQVVLISGNHELVMSDYASDPNQASAEPLIMMGGRALVDACDDASVLGDVREYARLLKPYWTSGGLALCHALPDPGKALPDQSEVSLFWNKSHKGYRGGWGRLIGGPCLLVHGHVRDAPLLRDLGLPGLTSAIQSRMDLCGRLCCDAATPESGELHLYEFSGDRVRAHIFTSR